MTAPFPRDKSSEESTCLRGRSTYVAPHRPHRGAHTAIAEAKEHLESGYQTVVDIDLEKFFDRVHHQRLLERVAQKVADRRVLALVRMMLTAKVVMPDGVKIAVAEGPPCGVPSSPRQQVIAELWNDEPLQHA